MKVGGEIVADENLIRIRALIADYLEEVGTDESGWSTLYRDPDDGRFWEQVFPYGYMHGGGPPSLVNLTEQKAREKYSGLSF